VDDPESLAKALAARHGAVVSATGDARLVVRGATAEEVGSTAASVGATVFELTSRSAGESLEQLYLSLTGRGEESESP
jgi:hypothetical protein